MENNPPKNNYTIAISIVVAAIVIGGAIIWAVGKNSNTASTAAPSQTSASVSQITSQDVILGNKNAPVTVIEYGDYQCPYCAEFYNNIEPALKIYVQSGKINMIFREMSFIGSESQMAAQASYCAADQGKFWEYHDLVYQTKYDDYFKNGGKENDGSLSNS
ncbi:MAG: DsbA family protein, partial [Patescibacteria group bacterium]|nr:DsbA family protein [Patescibacteria group bacterium]